ncbi:Pro-Fmrfamide-Related Neuropeptide Vf [Manis pentadactyla]|nr:Pro-Fmrfamide-Related Neuropeptide Vf [Manis pentadactyla]
MAGLGSQKLTVTFRGLAAGPSRKQEPACKDLKTASSVCSQDSLVTLVHVCQMADELMMSNLHSKENYDKYVEPKGDPTGKKERSLNFEEIKDWGPEPITKMSTPTVNKMPHPAADLPLRFGRTTEENRSPGAIASRPLRFGKNTKESISRHVPNLPQRFGRTAARVSPRHWAICSKNPCLHCLNGLLCSMICEPQDIQNPYQKHLRRLGFKKMYDAELKHKK